MALLNCCCGCRSCFRTPGVAAADQTYTATLEDFDGWVEFSNTIGNTQRVDLSELNGTYQLAWVSSTLLGDGCYNHVYRLSHNIQAGIDDGSCTERTVELRLQIAIRESLSAPLAIMEVDYVSSSYGGCGVFQTFNGNPSGTINLSFPCSSDYGPITAEGIACAGPATAGTDESPGLFDHEWEYDSTAKELTFMSFAPRTGLTIYSSGGYCSALSGSTSITPSVTVVPDP